jgi:hypothetical protein
MPSPRDTAATPAASPRERPAARRADPARGGVLFLQRDKFAVSLAVGLALAQAAVKADSRVLRR